MSGSRRTTTRSSACPTRRPTRRSPSAYRKLAKQYHPDANPGIRGAVQGDLGRLRRARRRGQAQGVRRGPPARAGRPAPSAAPAAGPERASPATSRSTTSATCSATCSAGGDRGPRRAAAAPAGPAPAGRGPRGRAAPLLRRRRQRASPRRSTSRRDAACHTCGGTGAAPGTSPGGLPGLRWPGRDRRQPGPLLVQPAVPDCARHRHAGRDPVPDLPRAAASSAGPARSRSASPPASRTASASGSRAGAAPGRNGGPAGRPVRRGAHATATRCSAGRATTSPSRCRSRFPEAALGANITVPTLDGPVTLKVPAGTRSGRTFRVQGRGVPASSGAGRPARHRRGRRAPDA